MIRLIATAFDPEAELTAFRRAAVSSGAIASFVGLVRPECASLTLECYRELAEPMILARVREVIARFKLEAALVIHRIGLMKAGDPIVLVACASAHRKAAIGSVDCLMDWLKSQAPFWKLEEMDGARRWIEPRAEDHAAAARWRESRQQEDAR